MKSVIDGVTTLYIGAHYEVRAGTVSKYYFAGSMRIAVRVNGVLSYLLGDHLGSTSITIPTGDAANANGMLTAEMRYKACPLRFTSGVLHEGEVRSWWTAGLSTTPAYELSKYAFTGQYAYMDDPSTSGVTEGFGLMFYNARWMDPTLGRFIRRFAPHLHCTERTIC